MLSLRIYWRICSLIKQILFKLLLGKRISFGKNTTFRKGFGLYLGYKGHISIGDNVFFNRGCSINALNQVNIGSNTLFGENVKIYDHNHRFRERNLTIREQGYKSSPVSIGENCWICTNVVILRGVTIGAGSVIGAGCVIKNDIPPNSLVELTSSTSVQTIASS